jgi:hypothetical protein
MQHSEELLEDRTLERATGPERVRATFRIYHPDLEPEQLTELLEITPSIAWRSGEDAYGWRKRPGFKAPSGGWLLSSRTVMRGNNASSHIDWLLDQLAGKANMIKDLQNRGFMIDVVVGWHATSWNTTPALSPDLMRRLAKLNLPIWFDVYLFGSEEKEIS